MDGDVMKMREVPGIDLPAGKTVELRPGGYHVMLMDLKGAIKAGDPVPLTLVFEGRDKKRESVEVKAEARQLGVGAEISHEAMKAMMAVRPSGPQVGSVSRTTVTLQADSASTRDDTLPR